MDVTQGPAGGGSRWIESMAGSHKQVPPKIILRRLILWDLYCVGTVRQNRFVCPFSFPGVASTAAMGIRSVNFNVARRRPAGL